MPSVAVHVPDTRSAACRPDAESTTHAAQNAMSLMTFLLPKAFAEWPESTATRSRADKTSASAVRRAATHRPYSRCHSPRGPLGLPGGVPPPEILRRCRQRAELHACRQPFEHLATLAEP